MPYDLIRITGVDCKSRFAKHEQLSSLNVDTNGINVRTMEIWITKDGEVQTNLMLIMAASVQVEKFALTSDGAIQIPSAERLRLEERIEEFADVAAVTLMCPTSVRSLDPYVAIRPHDDFSLRWLQQSQGIHLPLVGIPVRMNHGLSLPDIHKLCLDRRDGLALLSEAQSQPHASGRLHEFMRLFENAFQTEASITCSKLLPQFLQSTPYAIDKAETEEWLRMRDSASHADGKRDHRKLSMNSQPFVRESAVTPVINRVELAAYDVLLNKKVWGCDSLLRRPAFLADVHSDKPRSSGIVVYQGKTPSIRIDVVDAFGAYPMDLKYRWKKVPSDWYIANDR